MWRLDSDETLLIYRNTHNFKQSTMSSKRKNENNNSQYKSKLFKSMVKPRLSLSQKVNRIIQRKEELKELTTTGSATVQSTVNVANVISLNSIAEGIDYNQRIGKRVTWTGIYLDFAFRNAVSDDYGQWWIVQDKQPNGNLPGQANIMDVITTTGQAFKNTGAQGYTDRFKILAQDSWEVETGGNQINRFYKRYIKLKDFDTMYTGAAAGVGITNGIYLVLGSSLSLTSVCTYSVKCTFTDS